LSAPTPLNWLRIGAGSGCSHDSKTVNPRPGWASAVAASSPIIDCDSEISLKPIASFQRKNIFEQELFVARGI
jgi:hypothetical protein